MLRHFTGIASDLNYAILSERPSPVMRNKYPLLLRFGLTPFFVAALLVTAMVSPALAQ
jgi:hypothetical protein